MSHGKLEAEWEYAPAATQWTVYYVYLLVSVAEEEKNWQQRGDSRLSETLPAQENA